MAHPAVELNESAKISWIEIGEGVPILVIDDAFKNPHELVETAWHRRFHLPRRMEYYPGWMAPADLSGEKRMLQWIAKLFLDRIWPKGWPPVLGLNELVPVGLFAVMGMDRIAAANGDYTDMHVDGHSWLATLAYLFETPPGDVGKRGTAFWRHRATGMHTFFPGDLMQATRLEDFLGLKFIDNFRKAAARIPFHTFEDARKSIFNVEKSPRRYFSTEEDEKWQLLHFVEAKWNRLIAYPSWQIHSIVDMTEHNPLTRANARLTYSNFIEYPTSFQPKSTRYQGKGYLPIEGMISE